MDATPLLGSSTAPSAAVSGRMTLVGLGAPFQSAVPTEVDLRAVVGGRFVLEPEFIDTPTGHLHRAVDLQAGGAQVLVKRVPASLFLSPLMTERALRELRQLGRAGLPGILPVLSQGQTAEGDLYVALAPPPPGAVLLAEAIERNGPLPPDRARGVVLQVGEALIAAQQVGVLHRSLSPWGVFLGPEDEVQVMDFGLAEAREVGGRLVQGPPGFLAPEQAEGKPPDQRSSVYHVGALYYYVLVGTPPFAAPRPEDLLAQVLYAQVVPPSQRRPGLPAEVDHVVLKALEKSSARRHLTLRQLLNELEELGAVAARSAPLTQPLPEASPPAEGRPDGTLPGPRFAQTLIGVPAARVQAAPVTPAALAAAFSTAPPLEEADAATVPVPPLTQEEMDPAPPAPAARTQEPDHAPPPEVPPAMLPRPEVTKILPRVEHPGVPPPGVAAQAPAGPAPEQPFRETVWFKQGELGEYLQEAAAAREIVVTAEDRARLSLRRGGERTGPQRPGRSIPLPGAPMSEAELLAELRGGGRRIMSLLLTAVLALLGGLVYVLTRP
ncbi:MAG: protein kinase [Myxococcota bacterium]|nr:protein kinase [Myxococcota bacterium]